MRLSEALLILPIANSATPSSAPVDHLVLSGAPLVDRRHHLTTIRPFAIFMSGDGMAPSSNNQLALPVMGPDRPKKQHSAKQKQSGKVKHKALSTERSRQCRERQKQYSQNLEAVVRALRTEVCDLQILRNLRQEQSLQLRGSATGSLAKIIREYMTVFRHGMPAETVETAMAGKKRALTTAYQPTPDAQREFLNSIMDPFVEVFDWCGRFVLGANVVDTEDTLAVATKANLRVRVSQKTIEHLFPHIADNPLLCAKMLGKEICYPIRDTFFFASNRRVIKYVCDIDFAEALLPVAGDYETVLFLMSPPNQASLNDLAVRTSPGDLSDRSRLDVEFLLSDD
ncbi:hypothetical protein PHYBOEH_005797 [Phytophthora boehmeriae]|uniref:BZIP domain-containing protein n=1 Tax=Phytophthora boehmeriae TaxID=109152 RepID=A0A8T1X2E9_9STRA|nr:hypothetical protein PHYBOEH_005797 [Phytophthora boehmeriae]